MWQPEDAGPYVLDVALGVQWKVQSEESVDLCPFYSREIPIDFIEDKVAGQVFLLHGQSSCDTNCYTAKKFKASVSNE